MALAARLSMPSDSLSGQLIIIIVWHRSELWVLGMEIMQGYLAGYSSCKVTTIRKSMAMVRERSGRSYIHQSKGSSRKRRKAKVKKARLRRLEVRQRKKVGLVMCLVSGVEGWAELPPGLGDGVFQRNVVGGLSEHDGEAGLQVPVDVAVEEPRAWVVRLCSRQ